LERKLVDYSMPLTLSPFQEYLGRTATLSIRRFGPAGAFLGQEGARDDAPALLLLGDDIPEGAREGDALSVFVYLDSQDRPLATTRVPKLMLGEVAFLQVTATTQFGAFVDWGLPKELLIPFAEQTVELREGARHAIGLFVDRSARLAGTMRVAEMLKPLDEQIEQGAWVNGEAWRNEPGIGTFVIVERKFLGLLPPHEPHALSRGDGARFRVANILSDGKFELSLRRRAHEELSDDAERVLAFLKQPAAARVADHSSPEQIRALFGLSKKAFKRAIGRLLKGGTVELDGDGYVRLRR
jgi:uncharacterized protein